MADCSGDGGDVLQFCGVLPLLTFSQAKLSPEEVTSSGCLPPAVNHDEIDTVEEVKVVREEPPPSQALSQAEALLQKARGQRSSLEKELGQINTQLANIMNSNEELREEVRRAEKALKEVILGQPQLLERQRLRADDLVKEIDKFRKGELVVLEEEVCKLQKAQRDVLKELTTHSKLCEALLQCLKAKEQQVHREVWKLEDSATLLEGKGALWRQCEAATRKAGEEGRGRHQQALAVLEVVTQGFMQVTRRAEGVCVSLAPHHTPSHHHSSPSHTPPLTSSPS
ncbi:uncharacterized protein LOC123515014 [Portunus trituberculatus]|uniref:uncharacterized protein LOC123515014 n=1 Tax=Portunus trituberculatus TaxID=210409 RepID=UPI001E1CB23B|nr:uncharacterized protein LOC123515014 [Portunus trituberculatus]